METKRKTKQAPAQKAAPANQTNFQALELNVDLKANWPAIQAVPKDSQAPDSHHHLVTLHIPEHKALGQPFIMERHNILDTFQGLTTNTIKTRVFYEQIRAGCGL